MVSPSITTNKEQPFGLSTSLDDLSDLMDLISKCCGLTRSSPSSLPQSDVTLNPGCVPQVYDLEQLQQDIAIQFLAGKRLLQSPSVIRCDFRFKDDSKIETVSDLLVQCSATNVEDTLPRQYKEKLPIRLKKDLIYEFHTVQYHALLDVIIGLNCALRHLNTRLRELGDHQWNDYLHTTLADFLMDYIGCDSTYDILETVGIVRANRSASNVSSLRDSQYDFLENLEMRYISKAVTFLKKWMRLGMHDFSSLPFTMKVKMHDEDKISLRNVAQDSAANRDILDEIKTINEQLVRCERALVDHIKNKAEEVPIKQVVQEELGITEEMTGVVVGCISNGVWVQHYVHLRLELRRLQENIRGKLTAESGDARQDKPWIEWVAHDKGGTGSNFDTDSGDLSSGHGFRYENSSERDLAKQMPDSKEDDCKKADEPALNVQELTPATNSQEIDLTTLCCLPNNRKSPTEKEKLEKKYEDLKQFLEGIGLEQFAQKVEKCEFDSFDIIFYTDEELIELTLTSAVKRLKFRVLLQRELLGGAPDVAKVFGVKEVVEFFRGISNLEQYASIMETNEFDGELLLLAENDVFEELHVSAIGVRLIKKHFKPAVLKHFNTEHSSTECK